jgi:hypothetical protein
MLKKINSRKKKTKDILEPSIDSSEPKMVIPSTNNSPQDPASFPSSDGDDSNQSKREKLKQKLKESKSWLTSTKYFQRIIDKSFNMIDVDGSGDITLEELYAGLLLIHLQMAAYVGAPATKPASLDYVTEIFQLLDADNSGVLDKDEFTTVMKILYSQVFTRIALSMSITLLVVPLTTSYIVKSHIGMYYSAMGQRVVGHVWGMLHAFGLGSSLKLVGGWLAKIPVTVWKSVHMTSVTVAQTSVALPWTMGKVEDYFKGAAVNDTKKKIE